MSGDKPKVLASATQAWRDVVRAIADMPALALAAVVLGALFGVAAIVQARWIGSVPGSLGALAGTGVVRALWALLLTPLYLAIHRYIILGEAAPGYAIALEQPRFRRFFLCMLAIYALWLTPSLLLLLGRGGVTIAAMGVLSIVCLFVTTRLIILFPAIAVDAPGASFGNAYDDTQGCVWRIFGILIVATLPIIIATVVIVFAFGPQSIATHMIDAVVNMLTVALAVAIASRLYLDLADRLGHPGPGEVEVGAT